MSASPRPITASPRSSVYDRTASPVSPSSTRRGPPAIRPAPKIAVPPPLCCSPAPVATDTRLPTSVPQWPQNGRPGVAGLPHRGQLATPGAPPTRVGGTGLNEDTGGLEATAEACEAG